MYRIVFHHSTAFNLAPFIFRVMHSQLLNGEGVEGKDWSGIRAGDNPVGEERVSRGKPPR